MVPQRIFLIGLSGAGKTTSGRLLAKRLGWEFADADEVIAGRAGRSIPEIFERDGEEKFREVEVAALKELAAREPIVVATGGGAPTTLEGRKVLGSGFVVWLRVSPEEAARRLAQNPDTAKRPLLEGDLRARLEALNQARLALYEGADAAVDVEELTPGQAAVEVAALWEEWRRDPPGGGERFYGGAHDSPARLPASRVRAELTPAAIVRTALSSYPVIVQDGALEHLGAVCNGAGLHGRAFVLTDEAVRPLYGERAVSALRAGGYATDVMAIATGEEHKTLATVARVYDWLIDRRVERSDFMVCMGGGVVTDIGGFAAATCLRGIDFVHVPTTLLGMADAAVGGKTGVDHPRGKNLIGAFAQPRAVVMDPELLKTLPERHLHNGWAELLKHALILDEALMEDLEAAAERGAPLMSAELIGRSVAIKAEVVSDDEREQGRRTLLNYGHTLGHAIEAVTGYTTYLHGEAVAVGMRAAGMISAELGLLAGADLERQQRLIRAFGLPEAAPGLDVEAVLAATQQDKKVRDGKVRWVLLERVGHAVTRDGVPEDVVRRAAEAVLGPQ
jgi:shikimate kinase/3-dehydroquinate synthase